MIPLRANLLDGRREKVFKARQSGFDPPHPLFQTMSSFDSFKSSFKGDLVTAADPDYEEAIARWAATSVKKAKLVAFVKDAEDVSLAIKYAVSDKISFAIRGGGHSLSGASSVEGGLVIDLSRYLGGVTVDADKKLGYVGGGAIWKTVDETAIKYGLATVGGTVNHVSSMLLLADISHPLITSLRKTGVAG